MRASYKFSV
uniref:Uncharacterized protein n=1 Tax=Anguilla anguilla TaxID=7936 RepID=A0A0E9UVW6_ANGAN